MGVLGFAYINIFISIYGKEDFDLGVLGRGRAGQIAILCNFKLFYVILSCLMKFYIILFNLEQFYSKIQNQIAI